MRETLLGLAAQANEREWEALEGDFEDMVRGLELPRPRSQCDENDKFDGLRPTAWLLWRMFGEEEGEGS